MIEIPQNLVLAKQLSSAFRDLTVNYVDVLPTPNKQALLLMSHDLSSLSTLTIAA